MKNWNWKQWTAFGIIIAVIIIIIILHIVQPVLAFAWTELFTGSGFILGGLSGYLFKQKTR